MASRESGTPRNANRDSSVFVGASGSKASPHILLLLRVTHRYRHGFTVLASYTWSKALDYQSRNHAAQDAPLFNPFNFFLGHGSSFWGMVPLPATADVGPSVLMCGIRL